MPKMKPVNRNSPDAPTPGHRPVNPDRAQNQQDKKNALDPAFVAKAKAYFDTLDDSHRRKFLDSNPYLKNAFVLADRSFVSEVNRLEEGSVYQTTDGKPLDPSVSEPVFRP